MRNDVVGVLYADIDGVFGRFHESDRDLLAMLASQAAVALDNARWSQGLEQKVAASVRQQLKQRANELAIINSIQQGISASLDFQSIVDLVGDKLREVFDTGDIGIRWVDEKAELVHHLYEFEHGKRLNLPPAPLRRDGPVSSRLYRRETVVLNTRAESDALGVGTIPGTDPSKSGVFVPIVGSDRVLGSIILENYEREHAFGDAEVRLLRTVAAGMGVALENARLYSESQRLLKETEQRNAELAVINSIQQGMSASLDFQSIVDLVGDKLREVFDNGDIGIRWRDEPAGLIHYLYEYEHGVRITVPSTPINPDSVVARSMMRREPLVINSRAEAFALGIAVFAGTDPSKSSMFVPIVASDRVLGTIVLENYQRENAYGEAEVRLLRTVASGMGVAIENARLFSETQRLLKETEQRAAELAVINSIQHGMAEELDFKAIVDLVGDKLRELLQPATLGIARLRRAGRPTRFLLRGGARQAAASSRRAPRGRRKGQALEFPDPLRRAQSVVWPRPRRVQILELFVAEGSAMPVGLGDPIFAGERFLGFDRRSRIHERHRRFRRRRRAPALDRRGQHGGRARNARLFDETQRRTRETAALLEVGRDLSRRSTYRRSWTASRGTPGTSCARSPAQSSCPRRATTIYRAIVAVGEAARSYP